MPSRSTLLGVVIALTALAGCQTPGGETPDDGPPVASDTAPETGNELAEINTQLGLGYMRERQYDLAWKRLHKAIEADPGYSTAHNAMGLLYVRLGDPAKAEEHLAKAVALSPGDSAAQTNYGSFLCAQGRYEEGERRFMQALKNSLYTTPEIAYANAGLCAKGAGELEKADTYLRSALAIDPQIPSVLLAMAEINFESARHLPARAYLQRYLAVGEHTARSLWLGIRIERELGDDNAVASYVMLLENEYPDSEETRQLQESQVQ